MADCDRENDLEIPCWVDDDALVPVFRQHQRVVETLRQRIADQSAVIIKLAGDLTRERAEKKKWYDAWMEATLRVRRIAEAHTAMPMTRVGRFLRDEREAELTRRASIIESGGKPRGIRLRTEGGQ